MNVLERKSFSQNISNLTGWMVRRPFRARQASNNKRLKPLRAVSGSFMRFRALLGGLGWFCAVSGSFGRFRTLSDCFGQFRAVSGGFRRFQAVLSVFGRGRARAFSLAVWGKAWCCRRLQDVSGSFGQFRVISGGFGRFRAFLGSFGLFGVVSGGFGQFRARGRSFWTLVVRRLVPS